MTLVRKLFHCKTDREFKKLMQSTNNKNCARFVGSQAGAKDFHL